MDELGKTIISSTFSAKIMDETGKTAISSIKSAKIMDETGKTAISSIKSAKIMDEPRDYGSKWGIGLSLNRFNACLRSIRAWVAGSSQTPVRM